MSTMTHHTSWGRTRSPKNIAGSPGTAVMIAANTNNMLGSATDYKTFGYVTENQRYLHVLVTDANVGASFTVTVYGYCHAFERWFELPESHVPVGTNTAPDPVTIPAPADSGHEDAALLTPDEREYRTYEILGIDRVAFVGSNANTDCYAACSTF